MSNVEWRMASAMKKSEERVSKCDKEAGSRKKRRMADCEWVKVLAPYFKAGPSPSHF
jgi:hypothetical protein